MLGRLRENTVALCWRTPALPINKVTMLKESWNIQKLNLTMPHQWYLMVDNHITSHNRRNFSFYFPVLFQIFRIYPYFSIVCLSAPNIHFLLSKHGICKLQACISYDSTLWEGINNIRHNNSFYIDWTLNGVSMLQNWQLTDHRRRSPLVGWVLSCASAK